MYSPGIEIHPDPDSCFAPQLITFDGYNVGFRTNEFEEALAGKPMDERTAADVLAVEVELIDPAIQRRFEGPNKNSDSTRFINEQYARWKLVQRETH